MCSGIGLGEVDEAQDPIAAADVSTGPGSWLALVEECPQSRFSARSSLDESGVL